MPSPTIEVREGAGAWQSTTDGVNVTPGSVITGRLASVAGVESWSISVIGTDETSDKTAASAALSINGVTKTFSYTAPAAGKTYIFRSQVNGGASNGESDDELTTQFSVHTLTTLGKRVVAANQTTEANSEVGWVEEVNDLIRNASAGSSLPDGSQGNVLVWDGGEWTASSGLDVEAGLVTAPDSLLVSGGLSAVATSGTIRLPQSATIRYRNAANDSDYNALVIASDEVTLGSNSGNTSIEANTLFQISVGASPRMAVSNTGAVTFSGLAGTASRIIRASAAGLLSALALGTPLQGLRVNAGATDVEFATVSSGDPSLGGDLSGTASAGVVERIHGATAPAAGSLTTGNGLYVSGASALSYSALNLAGGANYVTGVLPAANQAAQTLAGDVTGPTSASVVEKITGLSGSLALAATAASIVWNVAAVSPTLKQTDDTGAAATGDALTIQAQNATGTASTGGALKLQSGTGTSAAGNVEFRVGSNLAGYFDSSSRLRIGPSASTALTFLGSIGVPSTTNYFYSYNASGVSVIGTYSGANTTSAVLDVINTNGGSGSTSGIRIIAAGTSHPTSTTEAGHGNIAQHGASTSALLLSSTLGDGTGFKVTGRIYQSGAWAIGDATWNDTSSEAQAGLTGYLINLSAASGTFTSAANQALLFNVAGQAHLQGHDSVRFDVGTALAGYFDVNKVLRLGASLTTDITVLGASARPSTIQPIYAYSSASGMINSFISGLATSSSIFEVFNSSGGASATTGVRLLASGGSHSNAAQAGNGTIQLYGASTSALVFTSSLGDDTGFSVLGRHYRSGAWTIGDATWNDTSSEAQAGLVGPLLALSPITSGTLTSTSTQVLVYNDAGVLTLQGHSGLKYISNTTTALTIDGSAVINIPVALTLGTNAKPSIGFVRFAGNTADSGSYVLMAIRNRLSNADTKLLESTGFNAYGFGGTADFSLTIQSSTALTLYAGGSFCQFTTAANWSFFTLSGSFGGGQGVSYWANATVVPTTNPTGGPVVYAEGGALKGRGTGGTIVTIVPA